ncbi:MAG: GAF domain-containing sensor histidine kinase, partial [Candidatus Omnitrophica bacterium]|nr:GAF domain-containing sensor histidine kinase [Candidatus Omnitrophota bacterium]
VGLDRTSFAKIAFGLALLFIPYVSLVQPRIDHLFQRRRWDLARAFEKFTDELVHLKSLDELAWHIVETIRSLFYVENISLLLSKNEESVFECTSSFPAKEMFRFERSHPFLKWIEGSDQVVLLEYLDIDPRYEPIKDSAKEYFKLVNAHVCVPLVLDQRILGIINVGQKANLKSFGAPEINFLADLRKTAAIAFSNSLRSIAMQESLRRWNVELEKKVEERTKELKETQTQLIQAEKLATIGTLAGGIAHEINNPLTAVLTNVQMLKMLDQVEDKESLNLIEEGAKRCQVIIQKLMRYARKTEEVETYEAVDINKVIRSVCDFLGYQLKQENIELILHLKELEPIHGIANELEQVFTNLIINARDAIKLASRKGRIEIKTEQRNGMVHIEFSDNGIGIKKERLARIFDPFYTTKDVGEGTGLGLTVSSGIVEKFLGKISVSSKEGEGTTFSIQFPLAKGARVK